MIFYLLAPPQGPSGRGKKMCRCTPHSGQQLAHKIRLDFVQWLRRRLRDGRTEGRMEAIAMSPSIFFFLKSVGIITKNTDVHTCFDIDATTY